MVSGYTSDVRLYNQWFTENYTGLRKYCKKYHIEEDLLNDVYCNIHNRIIRSGFTESFYMTYVKRSLRNLQINEGKKLNGKFYVDIENEDYTNTVENTLQERKEEEEDTLEFRKDMMKLSKNLFYYITNVQKYTDEELFVFRCYYLMQGRMTYKKLNVMTGLDKSKCTRIIKTFKKDIKNNFINWLHNDRLRMEDN